MKKPIQILDMEEIELAFDDPDEVANQLGNVAEKLNEVIEAVNAIAAKLDSYKL